MLQTPLRARPVDGLQVQSARSTLGGDYCEQLMLILAAALLADVPYKAWFPDTSSIDEIEAIPRVPRRVGHEHSRLQG